MNLIRKIFQRVKTLKGAKDFDVLDCFHEIDVFTSGVIDLDNLKKFFSDNSKVVSSDPNILRAVLDRVGGLKGEIDISNFYRIFEVFSFEQNMSAYGLESLNSGESQRNKQFMNW